MTIDEDVAYLEYQITKTAPRNLVLILLAAAAIMILGGINVWLAARFASESGHAFGEIVHTWFRGVSTSGSYSGLFIKAVERFENGLIEISISVLAMLQVVRWHQNRKRYARILDYLADRRV